MTVKIQKTVIPNLPATSSSMDNIAQAEYGDRIKMNKGQDDFILSFGKLMDAFDTFFKEYHRSIGATVHAGSKDNYDFSSQDEFTIYQMWQLRNIEKHHGCLVDATCKANYDAAFKEGKGRQPILKLPSVLQIGQRFEISHDEYYRLKGAIFRYIGKYVPTDDCKKLAIRSSMANVRITTFKLSQDIGDSRLVIDLDDLKNISKIPMPDGDNLDLPPYVIDWDAKRIIFVDDGTCVKFVLEKR